MATIYKYKIFCTTHSWRYIWSESTTAPTTCDVDSADTVNTALSSIAEIRKPDAISIKTESVLTGGHFRFDCIKTFIPANTAVVKNISYEWPINMVSTYLITDSTHTGDVMTWTVSPDTIIGALGYSVSAAPAWTNETYAVDDIVYFAGRNYKCLVAGTSIATTDTTHWLRQTATFVVSPTVLDYIQTGFLMTLYDGTNKDDVGLVLSIDKVNSTVTCNGASSHDFSPFSPTYVMMSIMYADHLEIGPAATLSIGATLSGASYVPANTVIRAVYENKSPTVDKTLYFYVQYLY